MRYFVGWYQSGRRGVHFMSLSDAADFINFLVDMHAIDIYFETIPV